jgi:hypothetical protein
MGCGLKIVIVEVEDPYYLGIEIHASNGRFSGATIIRIGIDQLTEFANEITGFPSSPHDSRIYEFGEIDTENVRGYCKLRFYCIDLVGHAMVDVELMDDSDWYPEHLSGASAKFSISTIASDLDRFTNNLRSIEKIQSGEASIGCYD